MNKRTIPYHKLNFLLSVIGFIGSLGFYYGVLRKVYADEEPKEKQRIEQLEKENRKLRENLHDCDSLRLQPTL